MKKYEEKSFDIPELKGLSKKQIEEHLKLYSGYVKHVNLIAEKLKSLEKDPEENQYLINELKRRLSFEFDGMRLHEYYFHSIEGGGKPLPQDTMLGEKINSEYGNFENWLDECIKVSGTRGVGWTILYYDAENDGFIMKWIDEHQIGHMAGLEIVMVVDVWEHAFMVDYLPSQKQEYIKNYLSNINWEIVAEDFENKGHRK